MTKFLLGILLSMALTFLFTPLVLGIARRRRVGARINAHSIHHGFVPKLGGVAIFVAWAGTLAVFDTSGIPANAGLVLGAAVMLLLGIIDDMRELSYRQKLLGQAAAAAMAVSGGILVEAVPLPGGTQLELGIWAVPLTMLWLIGMTNALNLLDGVDGLAAGTSAIAAVFFVLLGGNVLVAAAMAGACLAFLRFNFYPARIFLGDSGSLVLGFVLGGLAVESCLTSSDPLRFAAPLLVLSLPLADTGLAIVRRVLRGHHPFHADQEHLHHRLLSVLSNRQPPTVLLLYSVSLLGGFCALALYTTQFYHFLLAVAGTTLLVPLAVMWVIGNEFTQRKTETGPRAPHRAPANGATGIPAENPASLMLQREFSLEERVGEGCRNRS
jgi:UDP-GlcNAc:undecaprenyl-phosphate GlcNAc-1-phosphate transferase